MTDLASVAADLGLWVFPCDGQKHPCIKGGFKSAAADRARIIDMFRVNGAKLIGVPTGALNKIIVVDVDVKGGAKGLDWLNQHSDALPPTRTHKTRSGGLHLIFQCPSDVEIRNSAGRVAPGIDVRGEGGYVVWPPSEGYQVADAIAPAEMPTWLIRACLPPEIPAQPIYEPVERLDQGGTRYGLAALAAETLAVRNAPFGQQETTLNGAALKLGALVAGGHLDESVARDELVRAGNSMSSQPGEPKWTTKDIAQKVGRGMQDGSRRPRGPKDPQPVGYQPRPAESPKSAPDKPDKPDKTCPPDMSGALPYTTFAESSVNLDVADFVEGVLIEGAMSVVYGESNTGKTFWITDLALHVAAGKEWRGREVERGAVLYLALEGSHGIRNRIAAFKACHELADAALPFAIVTVGLNLLDPEADATAVIATCRAIAARFDVPVRLIVVDTLSRAMSGGNENAPEDMGALVKTGDLLRQATGAHINYVHHSGKDSAKGARGHSLLRAATDTEIEITADGKSRQAEVRKQRDLEGGDVWRFELAPVVLGTNRRGKDVSSCVVKAIDEHAPGGAPVRHHLKGHNKRALEVLNDLVAQSGQPGHPGVPSGISSVPEKWWRERFYERAMPGAESGAKQRAFYRAADNLIEHHLAGMAAGRVWIVDYTPQQNYSEEF
jgi:hypothetical protein